MATQLNPNTDMHIHIEPKPVAAAQIPVNRTYPAAIPLSARVTIRGMKDSLADTIAAQQGMGALLYTALSDGYAAREGTDCETRTDWDAASTIDREACREAAAVVGRTAIRRSGLQAPDTITQDLLLWCLVLLAVTGIFAGALPGVATFTLGALALSTLVGLRIGAFLADHAPEPPKQPIA